MYLLKELKGGLLSTVSRENAAESDSPARASPELLLPWQLPRNRWTIFEHKHFFRWDSVGKITFPLQIFTFSFHSLCQNI